MSWLICAAVPLEAELVIPRLEPAPALGGRPSWQGQLGRRPVRLILTGMGLINAAQAVTAALENLARLEGVINFGCAGAYAESGLELGQAAVASQVVLADQGVLTQRRRHGLEKIGIPLGRDPAGQRLYNRLPVDRGLSQELTAAGGNLPRGPFASVVQVSGDRQTARELARPWGAILEEMEGGAVALVALHYGLPFAAVRGISNQAGARELDLAAGARAAQRALLAWGEST